MRSFEIPSLRLIQRVMALGLTFSAVACGGDAPVTDASIPTDGGFLLDSGLLGPDQDGDEWSDDFDNCPAVDNPEQRDRDGDGVGDDCDSCPNTPNGGQGGAPGQNDCLFIQEMEPNDQGNEAEAVVLQPIGGIQEVRGVIEPPQGRQPVDRYALMLPAKTLLRVRVARSSPKSLLEPYFSVSGGAFTVPRVAAGLFVASREIYAAAAGTYEVIVSDRRGQAGGEPRGSLDYGYALAIEVVAAEPEGVTAPFVDRAFTLSPIGKVGLFQVDLAAAQFTRTQVTSDYGDRKTETGLDPILVVERADGTVLENADLAEGFANARIILSLAAPETLRVAIDHNTIGDDPSPELRLTIDQPATNQELEPNDLPSLASSLVFPGETSGRIDPAPDPNVGPPDEDWYQFAGTAGQVIGITGLIRPSSQVDPIMALITVDPEGLPEETLYVSADSSGNAPYIEAILPETRTYHLLVADERNLGDPPYRGGGLYNYGLFSEVIGIQPDPFVITASTAFSGILDPGGRVGRHLVVASGPTLIDLSVLGTGVPELEPLFRVFGPGAVGQIGGGLQRALAFLPSAETYVVGVQNNQQGAGGPAYSYNGAIEYLPLPGIDESEPNDQDAAADLLSPDVDVARGALSSETDVDQFQISLSAGTTLVAQLSIGGRGRTLTLLGPNGATLASAERGVGPVAIPTAGTYRLAVSGNSGPYVLAARAR